MIYRDFGNTGLRVPALGYGAIPIGSGTLSETEVEHLLNTVLDAGVTLIDTAPSYGLSEERIGRHLSGRRSEFLLSTKVGYGVAGIPDWTGPCIAAGVDAALSRLRTDCIDIVHLHSCGRDVLARGDVVEALLRAREAGKLRVAAYSGDNDDLGFAIGCGQFDAIQTSVNLCDQSPLATAIPAARKAGLGVLAKRPLANAPWRQRAPLDTGEATTYWERWQCLRPELPPDLDWHETALRFAANAPGVHCAIVGTSRMEHLQGNLRALARGPLPDDLMSVLTVAFARHGEDWRGIV